MRSFVRCFFFLVPLLGLAACGDLRLEFTPGDAGADGASEGGRSDAEPELDAGDGACFGCDASGDGDGGTGDFEDDFDGSDGFTTFDSGLADASSG